MKENVILAYQFDVVVVGEVHYHGLFHDVDHNFDFHITITNSCDPF